METEIRYVTGRTARARIRLGRLVVTMPRHWPRAEQAKTLAKFQRWAQENAPDFLLHPQSLPETPPLSREALEDLVARINQETLGVTYHGVRIGRSRYTRLAQVNLRTRVLTFSRYAIHGLPDRALRYLILHELAHLLVPNHSAKFWALVERHEPDYRRQRRIAQDHFQRMAAAADQEDAAAQTPAAPSAPVAQASAALAAAPTLFAAPAPIPAPMPPAPPPASKKGGAFALPFQLRLF